MFVFPPGWTVIPFSVSPCDWDIIFGLQLNTCKTNVIPVGKQTQDVMEDEGWKRQRKRGIHPDLLLISNISMSRC